MTSFNPPPEDPQRPPQQPPQQPYGAYPPQPPGSYPPAPPGYGYGQPPAATGTNGMAIAGFVLAFFCSLLGLIFSIIGLNQTKARNQSGRGLAIAGIVISILGILGGIIVVTTRN